VRRSRGAVCRPRAARRETRISPRRVLEYSSNPPIMTQKTPPTPGPPLRARGYSSPRLWNIPPTPPPVDDRARAPSQCRRRERRRGATRAVAGPDSTRVRTRRDDDARAETRTTTRRIGRASRSTRDGAACGCVETRARARAASLVTSSARRRRRRRRRHQSPVVGATSCADAQMRCVSGRFEHGDTHWSVWKQQ